MIRIHSEATISSTLPLSKEGILHVFNPRFCCSVLHHCFCCTGFLVFDLQASTLLPVLQASTLLPDLQAPTLLPVLQASPLLQVFKCLHCFQVFKCHHCFRCIVLAIVLTFPLNLYVLRSFHRLISWTGESHHRSEICLTELALFQTRCIILARSHRAGSHQMDDQTLQGHADLRS